MTKNKELGYLPEGPQPHLYKIADREQSYKIGMSICMIVCLVVSFWALKNSFQAADASALDCEELENEGR